MPIYEYRCDDCGRRFEELLVSSSDMADCPQCGSKTVHRLLSTFAATKSSTSSIDCGQTGCPSGGFT